MSNVKPIIYRSEYGDYYAPIEHYTFEQALEELCDDNGWTDEEGKAAYSGIEPIPLHSHSMYDDEIYDCPNYDEQIGDEPDPCIGYVKCHVFE
jgi:hypothetical protein